MPLNFNGHILQGSAKRIFAPIDTSYTPGHVLWTHTILGKMNIDADFANWCFYRLELHPEDGIGSAESVIFRTAVRRLIEAVYANWEAVVSHIADKVVEVGIEEFHSMADISKEYPVVLWQYYEGTPRRDWVSAAKAGLPSKEALEKFYDLPHMRERYVGRYEFCDNRDRDAEKSYRKALADRNRRLNQAQRKLSRSRKNTLTGSK